METQRKSRCVSNMLHTNMQTAMVNASEFYAGEQDRLKEYHDILLHGLGYFKPQAPSSRKAVEIETSLGIGKKKIPVDSALRSLALELSIYLVRSETGGYCTYHHNLMPCSLCAPGQAACQECPSLAPLYLKRHIFGAET